jgi:DNA-binding MurR/RpiR family transcriptional regulator
MAEDTTPFALASECLDDLPRKQRELARALLEQPHAFAFGSLRELGRRFDADATTILRFAQALGYSGYQALQASVRRAYLDRAGLPALPERVAAASTVERVEAVRMRHLANLAEANQRLGPADLERAAALLVGAGAVLVAGDGVSATLASLFATMLRRAALPAERLPPEGLDRTLRLAHAGPGDAVVGIGLWLPFRGVAETLAAARRQGAATVAIAGSPGVPLAREADVALIAPALGAGLSFSMVATVAVMELLVAEIAGRRPDRVAEIEQLLHDRSVAEGLLAAPEGDALLSDARPAGGR